MSNRNSYGQLVRLTIDQQRQLDHLGNMQAQANAMFSHAPNVGNVIWRAQQILDSAQVVDATAVAPVPVATRFRVINHLAQFDPGIRQTLTRETSKSSAKV